MKISLRTSISCFHATWKLASILIIVTSFYSFSTKAQVNVPDPTFRLLLEGFHNITFDNNNNITNPSVAAAMKSLTIASVNPPIQSLAGIEAFTGLTSLNCSFNQLTSLDLTANKNLITLSCYNNKIASLNISGLTKLQSLNISDNQVPSLNISTCIALKSLQINNNNLTSIDLSLNTALTDLGLGNNSLTSLDISKNTALENLDCNHNKLTSLDLSKNTTLEWLYCYNNQLTSLNISKNEAIREIQCAFNQIPILLMSETSYDAWRSGTNFVIVDKDPITQVAVFRSSDQNLTIGSAVTGGYVLGTTGAIVNIKNNTGPSSSISSTTGINPTVIGSLPSGTSEIFNNTYWTITNPALTGTYNLILDLTPFTGISDFNKIKILKRIDGSNPWQDVTSLGGVTIEYLQPFVLLNGLTSFSDFAIGKPARTGAEILSFSLAEQTGDASISSGTIGIEVSFNTNRAALVPTFTLSPGASAKIGVTPQLSSVTSNNFNNPVTYTITAEDGITTQNWIVSVIEPKTDILSFSFNEQVLAAIPNTKTHTVDILLQDNTDVTSLVSTFFLTPGATTKIGATPQVSGTTTNNFLNPVTYSVTAADGITTQNWVVTVHFPPPTITSFIPTMGPIGTTVTIVGTNFNTTPSNNIVFFGATQATVTTATVNTLTMNVPIGATYQPITVLVGGLMAYSSKPFLVTLTGGVGAVNTSSFASKIELNSGSNFRSISIGDLNGDGKSDLATIKSSFPGAMSIFKNINTNVSNINFNNGLDFAAGGQPSNSVSVGDLDGDGKLDLVVTNLMSTYLSIFKNTSTLDGSVSYAPLVKLEIGTDSYSVSIGDLDGDGKPDLAVVGSNAVSIFRNTSSKSGVISFAPKVTIASGTSSTAISMADVDGDSKTDLVIANLVDNSVSILRNKGIAIGIISFETSVIYPTGTNPYSLSIGDLNGDGKADLVTANINNNTISVLQNNSSIGSINYSKYVDFVTGSGPNSIAINDLNGDGKLDLAVTNSIDNTLSLFRNLSSISGTISFASKVDFIVGTYPQSISIGDLDNDGKVDLAVANINGISLFRNSMTIQSSEANINSFGFLPQNGTAVINSIARTVDIDATFETNVTKLIPVFTLSSGATAKVNGVTQVSGVTSNDFTSPVSYVITSEDGNTINSWLVTVIVKPNSATDLMLFSFTNQITPATINGTAHTVSIEVDKMTDRSTLIATFELSAGASAKVGSISQVSGVTVNNFTNPVTYSITAEDGITNQNWIVSVFEEVILGIEDLATPDNIFPNPANEELIISLSSFELNKPVKITIVDLTGRRMIIRNFEGGTDARINISQYSSGMYLLVLQQEGKNITHRFIKN